MSRHPELRNSRLSAEERHHQLELIISGVMNLYHRSVTDPARFLHEELEAVITHCIRNQRIDEEDSIEIKCQMESVWADYCKKIVSFSDVKRTAEKMANYL